MGDLFHIPDQDRGHFRIHVKHHLQLMFAALHSGHGDDVIEHRRDPVRLFCRGQGALHDLCVVKHVVNLMG